MIVFMIKPLNLECFPAKCPHHTHAGHVLLHGGGERALCLVRLAEPLCNFCIENAGISGYHRDKTECDQADFHIHCEHDAHIQGD